MTIVEKIRLYVKHECSKPTSKYGLDAYNFHFVPMARFAEALAKKLGGDREVILLAAWLHDIGSIIHGRADHHLTGAKIAEAKLRQYHYPPEKIALVKKCILNHRGSKQRERISLEEKIVAEADVLSAFDNISGQFAAALIAEKKDQREARQAVRQKLKNKWKQIHSPDSRRLVKPKYEAAMLLLK